jgi:MFS family permease
VAAALVFIASGAVLVLEILGIRLLAPYVGLTLETTTTIIGTVLAGIAAGAALGGRAADRMDERRLLALLFAAGGGLAIATVPVVRGLGTALRGGGDVAAFLVTLLALFPPAAVLSAVTPTVARMQLRDLATTGSVVGRISAWATAGGLVGTFVTGFVIVPLLPTDVAVLAVGGVLLALGLAVGASPKLLVAPLALAALTLAAGSPCDAETDYHCARVVTDPSNPSGRTLYLEELRHSYVDLEDPSHLEFDYTRWIGDAIDGMEPSGPLDAVFIGGGGFTLPRYVAATRPGSASTVLEVDGDLVTLVRERLGLRTGPELEARVGDARVTLRDEPDDSADLVVGDAFGGRAVPWHLTTAEFAEDIRRVLRPEGVYALNLIDYAPLGLARAEAATLLSVFEHVAVIAHAEPGGNLVMLASDAPIPDGMLSSARGATPLDAAEFADGADPLRDEDAPADQLLTGRA